MTKTEARKRAGEILRGGYFSHAPRYEVHCRCLTRLSAEQNYFYRPARKGEPWSAEVAGRRCVYTRETIREALIRVIVDHLLSGECGQ